MKRLIKKMIVSCSALFALALVAMMSPAADAGEFCSVNNSYMRSCSFDTMEQCHAMLSGRDGTCIRDPLLADNNSALLAHKRTAFASVQRPHHRHKKHHNH